MSKCAGKGQSMLKHNYKNIYELTQGKKRKKKLEHMYPFRWKQYTVYWSRLRFPCTDFMPADPLPCLPHHQFKT